MVESNANQKTNKCTNKGFKPKSIKAGPATDTQITYAAVVGTSIPRIMQAKAVRIKANHKFSPDKVRIVDVTLIPNPVIPRTPTISEAQRIIDAIVATCWPEKTAACANLDLVFLQSNLRFMSTNSKKLADKIPGGCGCGKRKAKLNQMFPYGKK